MDLKQLVASNNFIKTSGYSRYMQMLAMEYRLFLNRYLSTLVQVLVHTSDISFDMAKTSPITMIMIGMTATEMSNYILRSSVLFSL